MIIDAHHHLWRFDPQEYGWITEADSALRRDFLLPELDATLGEAGVGGCIAVQARQSVGETAWLLGLACRSQRIRGVVGWAPLGDPGLADLLDGFSGPLVGLRHVVQEEADPHFMLRPAFAAGLREIARRGLCYDLLLRHHQLEQAIATVDAHPQLRFVLDHIAKPDFTIPPTTWADRIRELAKRPNVCCKLSGVASEIGPAWQETRIAPWLDVVIAAFGPGRLLFGSDWPVCLPATSYRRWLGAVRDAIAGFSVAERDAILGGNAATVYRLEHR